MNMQKMKWMAAALLLAGSVAWAAELSEADKHAISEANTYWVRGNKASEDGSLERARVEYKRALKIFPKHVDALYNLAVTCEKMGENKEAVGLYKQYLDLKPDDADVWSQLGGRYEKMDQKEEAQAAFEKALALNPKFGIAHHNLGVMLMEQGKMDEAQKHLETFVQLEEAAGRKSPDAYYSLGGLLLARGRVKDAKLQFLKALDADPSLSYVNNAMGDVYLAEKHADLAVDSYKKALEKDSKYAPAYSGLGDAYGQLGQVDKAAESYRKALQIRSDYNLVHYKLGLLFETAKPAEAIKHFEKYLSSGKKGEFAKEAQEKLDKLKPKK